MTPIQSIFVRHRNALLLRGQFTDIYTDYYLHCHDHGLRYAPALDAMLKDALAVLTLHLTARPWTETIAWTANLRAPRVNLFVTGSPRGELVTGRVFTEDVREPDRNYFYAQTTTEAASEPQLSTLEIEGNDPVSWLEQLYLRSEQRPARCFRLPDEHFALIVAQPDCDLPWLEALDDASVAMIEDNEETSLLETRRFHFHCGCNLERILPILACWKDRLDELFQEAEEIAIQCPRCAAGYRVIRTQLAALGL